MIRFARHDFAFPLYRNGRRATTFVGTLSSPLRFSMRAQRSYQV